MTGSRPTVELYCLLAPERAEAQEAVRAYYADADPRVRVIVDRRGAGPDGAPDDERRPGADRRRQIVPRRLLPLPGELTSRAGHIRFIQRLQPVASDLVSVDVDEVVAALHAGDPAAAPELYWRSYERIHSRMKVLLGDAEAAHTGVARAFGAVLDALEGADAARFSFEQILWREVERCAHDMTHRDGGVTAPAPGGLAIVDPGLDEAPAIVEHDPRWAVRARAEREHVHAALGVHAISVEHIGGTAVEGLAARPIIDLLVGLEQAPAGAALIGALEDLGYVYRGNAGAPGRQYLRMPGVEMHVDLHVVEHGSSLWEDALLLRDYLRHRPGETTVWAGVKRNAAQGALGSSLRYAQMRREHLEELLQRAHAARGEVAQRAV